MIGRKRAPGALEAEIMQVLWDRAEPISAREVQEALTGPEPATTTVLTVLDRLHKKGLVRRCGEGPRKVRFTATQSGEEQASTTMLSALGGATDREAVLLKFAGNLQPDDVDVLRRALEANTRQRG
ncbi:BlaI/MecI/CopY family transcriptional regulator [Tessaracoccus rhinocerotis]|uniref:BlaI/MecI/CopY family transcriptional regulator n=1 Tax=Tessaracoccus rhinocerotis TaxID=1689449 RepID=A0A553JXG2_9ACTN|nr:BlaI/MecI/CopY family transcriptional regulator [Tessaracoccus rhinocerotis]